MASVAGWPFLGGYSDDSLFVIARIVCLFDLILYVQSIVYQLCRDESSWVEPVLTKDKCVLLKDTTK